MNEQEFQTKVLDGITAQKSQIDQLTSNYGNLEKDTKKTFEEITALKRVANDTDANFKALQQKLSLLDARLQREVRSAFGSPIQRILADEEKCLRIKAASLLAVDSGGDMRRVVEKMLPEDLRKKALGEDSSPGSTMIDDALANEIYDTLASFGVWNTFGVRRLGTKQTKFPVKTARPIAGVILTEADQIPDDTTKAGTSVTLEVEVIAALLNVSMQLIEDSPFDVAADVLNDFTEAYNNRLDYLALAADGTNDSTNGGMTGAFIGGTPATAAAGGTSVQNLDEADVRNCLLTVDAGVLSRPARWWMHPQILVRMLSIKDDNGRSIFLTANEAPTPGGIGSIYGYPVTLAHAAPSTNTSGSRVACFGDPNAQVVGVRRDYTFEASDHHKWNTLQRSYRAFGRAGVRIRRANGLAVLTLA